MSRFFARTILTVIATAGVTIGALAAWQDPSQSQQQLPALPPLVVQRIAVHVDQPARVGLPIWVHCDLSVMLQVRYPYGWDPRYFGPNRLELRRDGQEVVPFPLGRWFGNSLAGFIAKDVMVTNGSAAPVGSPTGRLPLHLAFAIDRAGSYSVRWSVIGQKWNAAGPERDVLVAQSDWVDFVVGATSAAERESWLRARLADRPGDPGKYVGDYLPSLLVAMPDPRVGAIVVADTASPVDMVSGFSAGALKLFPPDVAVRLAMDQFRQHGPNPRLAAFLSPDVRQDQRQEIVRTAISFLASTDDIVVEGALNMLASARGLDWRGDGAPMREADRAVEAAAPALLKRGSRVNHALALYLPAMKSEAARGLLWDLIQQRPQDREQALIALTWMNDARDLSRLADALVTPGGPDPTGRDLASVPYHLMRSYGEAAFPFLRRAIADSPYQWVRVNAAQEMALKGQVEGFRFLLDAFAANRPYKAEMARWLCDRFNLPGTTGDAQLVAFLNDRIKNPRPPGKGASDA